jgi:hypothetical protein
VSELEHPRLPNFEVHIFSQGRPHVRSIWSRHDIALYSEDYTNEKGQAQRPDYWTQILREALDGLASRVNVTMRLSQNTLRSIATMAAADIFIASRSQLATDVVSPISRGVQLLPRLGKESATSIQWDFKEVGNETFCASCFNNAWREYRRHFNICFPE